MPTLRTEEDVKRFKEQMKKEWQELIEQIIMSKQTVLH